jgi:hypothetical protein
VITLQGPAAYSPAFQAARAFAVLAPVWGGLASAGLVLVVGSACSGRLGSRVAGFSGLYLLAALSQGLAFLLLDSNLCSPAYLEQYVKDYYASNSTSVPAQWGAGVDATGGWVWVSTVSCAAGPGLRMAVAAVVLYCACAGLSLRAEPVAVGDPLHWRQDPVGDGDDGGPLVAEKEPPAGGNGSAASAPGWDEKIGA